jgi:curved DNA-binding protein CbpA
MVKKRGRRTLYDVLGVTEDAELAQLRSAWRQAAKDHHPDLHPDDDAHAKAFKLAKRAWEVLSDTTRRQRYDAKLARIRQPRCRACAEPVLKGQQFCPLCALTVASAAYETVQGRVPRAPTEADRLEQEYAWVADPSRYQERMGYTARAPDADALLEALMTQSAIQRVEREQGVSFFVSGHWGKADRRALQSVARSLGRATQWIDELRRWVAGG